MKQTMILWLLSYIFIWNFANAQNLEFQNIRVGGTGCPTDVTQIVTAPDLSSASILFASFESHVPGVVDSPKATPYISNLNCNVFLDIKLPPGLKLDSLEISYDMRGHTYLDRGVSGSFRSYLISSNGLGTERTQSNQLLQSKNWINSNGEQEEDFTVQSFKSVPILSQCNAGLSDNKVTVHLQHQLGSQILRGYEATSATGTITMDTSDLKGGIKLSAHTSPCRISPTPPAPPRPPRDGRNCRVIRVNGRAQTICQ